MNGMMFFKMQQEKTLRRLNSDLKLLEKKLTETKARLEKDAENKMLISMIKSTEKQIEYKKIQIRKVKKQGCL